MELIIALIFASTLLLGLGLASLVAPRPAQRRLARLSESERGRATAVAKGGVLADSERTWLVRALAPLAGKSATRGTPALHAIRKRLVQAGFRSDSALTAYMGSRVALALLLPSLTMLTPLSWQIDELKLAVLLCCAAAIGLVAPSYWLDRKIRARQEEIVLGLPDALDLMVVCVEAGLGINASLARVSREFALSKPALSEEFELVTMEIRAGKSTPDALRGLAERTGVGDMSSLVSMLIQTERFGTSLADTLRVHADSMRVQRLQRAEEQASKAPLKMLFPTVLIFVATLMVTIGPGFMQLTAFFRR